MEDITINYDQGETDNIINYEPIKLKQNENEYNLNIKSKGEMITFSINVKKELLYYNYMKKISFREIKKLNKVFSDLNSFNEFYGYLKSLSDIEKLNIKKYNDKISIIIYLEVLLKQEEVEIDLFLGKQDIDFNMQIISKELLNIKENEIYKLNEEIKNLKKENTELNKEINNLKKEDERNQKIKDKEKDKKFDDNNNEIGFPQKKIKNRSDQNIIIIIISIVLLLILYIMINDLKNENKLLNKEIGDKNKEINNLKNENQSIYKEIGDQNKEINNLKNENKLLNEKIVDLIKEIIYLRIENSIMELSEEDIIFSEIEKRMNKTIKGLHKLYQATTDGGDPKIFHKKCDNIPNTLVLIKSEGNRRFGGFTPIPWKSSGEYIKDEEKQTFVFSLDNKKIYNLKDIDYNNAVYHYQNYGPCFGLSDIEILGNPIKEYKLHSIPYSFDYKGDEHPLSESNSSDNYGKIKALEYEVFQVLFD